MSELPWKLFEKTGNLEAYLLMKQVEELSEEKADEDTEELSSVSQVETK
ncbi:MULTISPECIES: YqzL family protein [Allobacillus]|uniref:YqzL family protein n=1 Tax=Allobacillus halotolerans TaxID=570278 RepID=A0ABS6GKI4_9BACI|nr:MULTISPECIES: YqzL family protein [Allobacillus]MBU6079694.1 YqzL family protein [Allobacillus halotolerans]TSJ68222.1 YqzL family protein [Allobacillus sp. SKP2-8]